MRSKNGKYGMIPALLVEQPELIDPTIVGVATVLSNKISGVGVNSATELVVALAEWMEEVGFWDVWTPPKVKDPGVDELFRKGREDGEKRRGWL